MGGQNSADIGAWHRPFTCLLHEAGRPEAQAGSPFLSPSQLPPTNCAREHVRGSLEGSAVFDACGLELAQHASIVTLAPELPGAIKAIQKLSAEGVVVGLGRTSAELMTCRHAVAAGARLVTQVFSCMLPFHHRDPGPVGLLVAPPASAIHEDAGGEGGEGAAEAGRRALATEAGDSPAAAAAPTIFYSMAVGAQHAHAINLAHSTNPDGCILVSAEGKPAAAEGQPAAAREAGEGAADEDGGHGGGIASGAARLWSCSGEADPSAALLCGSAHPAQLLGLGSKGHLAPGADADLVLLDDELRVRACFVAGQLAWAHPELRGALWYHS